MPILIPLFELLSENIDNPFDYAKLTDVDYTAVVVDEPDSNGKVIITERLTYDIHAASKDNLFWELWRALPEGYVDGLKVDYKVNSVKQLNDDGTEVIYTESPKLYWDDEDYVDTYRGLGPEKWYHSKGPYNEAQRRYECVLFYVDGLYRENVVFEIEYEMNNAALRYDDCSELYLCLYSEETIKDLKSFKGQILFPNKDMPSTGNYYAHTYGTTKNSFPFTESDTLNPGYHTFAFELDKSDLKFGTYNQYIEFALVSYGPDKHIFTEYAPSNKYSNDPALEELQLAHEDDANLYKETKRNKTIVFLICFAGAIWVIIVACNKDKKLQTKYKLYKPSTQVHYFRDIPSDLDPTFASDLVFIKDKKKKDNKDGYSAIMLSLIRKGYIELVKINNEKDWKTSNVKIIVKYKPLKAQILEETLENTNKNDLEPLTITEQYYFNLIVRHSNGIEISMNSLQSKVSNDYTYTDTFVRNIENSTSTIGTGKGYFQISKYDLPKQELKKLSSRHLVYSILLLTLVNFISYQTRLEYAFGGFCILGLAYLFSSIYLKNLSKKYILLTQFGEDEYAKWRGLYEFLNSETLMSERTVIELPLWEKYLVYATAFGISQKVINALKIRCPEINMSPMLRNPYYSSNSFYSSSRSFRSVARSTSHTVRSGYYSSYSGYGSFSGGRGGGGGRRRSLMIQERQKIFDFLSFDPREFSTKRRKSHA